MAELVEATAGAAIAAPTVQRQGALQAIIEYLTLLRSFGVTRRGLAGDGAGTVDVTGRASFAYARLGAADGDVIEARNILPVMMADNDPILLARERAGGLGGWLIVDWYGTGTPTVIFCDEGTCGLTVHWQDAIYNSAPDVSYAPYGDAAVAVRENFAYVAVRGRTASDGLSWEDSLLQTWDLSDSTAPVKVDEQTLVSESGKLFANVGIAARDDSLWVYGMMFDGVTFITEANKYVKRYDISTRSAPSYVTEWITDMYQTFVTFRNIDEGGAFTGGTYLLGLRFTGTNLFDQFIVEDATDGTVIGTLDGEYQGYGGYDMPVPPLVCGNTVIAPGRHPNPLLAGTVRALDLSDPTTPTELWEDTDGYNPFLSPQTNCAYARTHAVPGVRLYTQVAVDDTATDLDSFSAEFDDTAFWGWHRNGTCYTEAISSGIAAGVSITNLAEPHRDTLVTAPLYELLTLQQGRTSDADEYGGVVYAATVGINVTGTFESQTFLTVFTDTS